MDNFMSKSQITILMQVKKCDPPKLKNISSPIMNNVIVPAKVGKDIDR